MTVGTQGIVSLPVLDSVRWFREAFLDSGESRHDKGGETPVFNGRPRPKQYQRLALLPLRRLLPAKLRDDSW